MVVVKRATQHMVASTPGSPGNTRVVDAEKFFLPIYVSYDQENCNVSAPASPREDHTPSPVKDLKRKRDPPDQAYSHREATVATAQGPCKKKVRVPLFCRTNGLF